MIPEKTLLTVEFDKILKSVSEYAVLENSKAEILATRPSNDYKTAIYLLNKTTEAYKLLYTYSFSEIYFFSDVTDELDRADKGGTLNTSEILRVVSNLKSARIIKSEMASVNDDSLTILPEIISRLFTAQEFEKEISKIIIAEDEISDNASAKLASIRKSIRNLNALIRDKLNSYMHGSLSKYLQEDVVTMRQDRFVIPVKSEYRSQIKGFIHDQSSSGQTVFIEPDAVLDLNNQLKSAMLSEKDEIHRILAELTLKISNMSSGIRYNAENISEIDVAFAKAIYSFRNKCVLPNLNDKHIVEIKKGKHPLIDSDKVVPVDITLGTNYNYLLITGPNTGGKTVSLKLLGLLTVMSMSGLYIPCEEDSKISFFSKIYTDVGDEQSIEQNLSTFSSHIQNIKIILENADNDSLILLDEIGAGTDPEEGSALALAIIKKLLDVSSFGIITTHYSKLKEFASGNSKIENACMEFDAKSLKPLYKLNVGIPGSSNAIEIAKTLGVDKSVIENAYSNLSDKTLSYEKVLKKAEEERRKAEELSSELERLKIEKEKALEEINLNKEKISSEREKIYNNAKQETKRIVQDKLAEAEEIIEELKYILKKVGLESKELFRAGELKNRLLNSKYLNLEDDVPYELVPVKKENLSVGDIVYVKSANANGKVSFIKQNKPEVEVYIGNAKIITKISDLFNSFKPEKEKEKVKIFRSGINNLPLTEINLIGKTSLEAETELVSFMSQAVMNNLEEVKIIHGVGEGILLKTVREYLKNDKNVLEFRRGKYGEGENGVTIVKLK